MYQSRHPVPTLLVIGLGTQAYANQHTASPDVLLVRGGGSGSLCPAGSHSDFGRSLKMQLTLRMEGRVAERTCVPDTRVQSVCPTFELLIMWVNKFP